MGLDVGSWCERHLGSAVTDVLSEGGHLSRVTCVRLPDGREVAVKARRFSLRLNPARRCSTSCGGEAIRRPSLWLVRSWRQAGPSAPSRIDLADRRLRSLRQLAGSRNSWLSSLPGRRQCAPSLRWSRRCLGRPGTTPAAVSGRHPTTATLT
jgi:hypothetical protein